ncbi:MAG: hypothetical protein ABH877_04720, partial [bacterium]
ALLLGLANSFVRPLRRARSRPLNALSVVALTVLVNALVLQVFVWARTPLAARNFGWILIAAAFVSLIAGVINWLVGFKSKEKARPLARGTNEPRHRGRRRTRTPRTRS